MNIKERNISPNIAISESVLTYFLKKKLLKTETNGFVVNVKNTLQLLNKCRFLPFQKF